MTGISVDVSELNRLAVDLGDAPRRTKPKIRTAVAKTTLDVEADAKAFAPVDTGNLMNSISSEISEDAAGVEGVVGPSAGYGVYVEFGTYRMAPRAFMGPAFDRNAHKLQQACAQAAADGFR